MPAHAESTGFDPFIRKEGISILAEMGFGKKEPRLAPHRHHGIAARTRLSVAGKSTMTTAAQHRHQHHKERVTIQQVNELSEVARDIESFVEAGRRVPSTIWEKYDRINKRHKKHGEITTVAAELRSKTRRRRRVIKQEHTDKQHANETDECRTCSGGDGMSAGSRHLPSRLLIDSREPVSSLLFRGGGSCTFGSGRGDKEPRKMLSRRSAHAHVKKWKASPSLWGPYERKKMNELYWELGRPPRRGADASREHFHRYTQRHCMVFPHRSPKEVIERLKLMFRYNAMKEPNEREHWLRLNASKGFFPITDTGDQSKFNREADERQLTEPVRTTTVASTKKAQPQLNSPVLVEPTGPDKISIISTPTLTEGPASTPAPLLLRSRKSGGASSTWGLSNAAASYAAEAIAAASTPFSHSRLRASGKAAVSPFYHPTRLSSPSWGFGEAPGSRQGSRGGSSGGGSRDANRTNSLSGFRRVESAGNADEYGDGDKNAAEETELLNYTSLGPQIVSYRATSPAHGFSREGLGSENLSMFQAEKKPEPGPGSFQPNLSATSTHPGPRCGALIGPRGSRGGIVGESIGGNSGNGAGGNSLLLPGPGQYSAWDSIGRQILSTRPSSPVITFATGEWELR